MLNTQTGRDLDYAAQLLSAGEVVAIPTETVYGLAANAFSEDAVRKVYAIKQRPLHNPLIVHIADAAMLEQLAIHIPAVARQLIKKFSPGPLTVLLEKRPIVPSITTSGLPHVAIRIPAHPLTLELLKKLPFPLAAPSANPFGYISPTRPEHVLKQLGGKIHYILDGGICDKGIESTVVGFQNDQPIVHRLGAVSLEDIRRIFPDTILKTHEEHAPVAPGMLKHHYSPNTRTVVTESVKNTVAGLKSQRVGVIAFDKDAGDIQADHLVILSAEGNLEEAARNLYDAMHELDRMQLDVIVIEKAPDHGIGRAINDRLARASSRQ